MQPTQPGSESTARKRLPLAAMLSHDPLAMVAVGLLLTLFAFALIGPILLRDAADTVDLRLRNLPPGWNGDWEFILGADTLGRSLLARIIVGARNTLGIASAAVAISMVAGGALGLIAGYVEGWLGVVVMRVADVLMSFPSLLLAMIVLYLLGPSILNVVLVLSITRIPVYLRTTRAEVLSLRERMFVNAARIMGASRLRIVIRHIVPQVLPTLATVAAIDFAAVILAESGLSFLGLGIQPPEFTWGAMVATGRNYLNSAWWLALWPGLAIMATTLALNILASWIRTVNDPTQRWRLEGRRP